MKPLNNTSVSLEEFLQNAPAYLEAVAKGDDICVMVALGGGRVIVLQEGKAYQKVLGLASAARLATIRSPELQEMTLSMWERKESPPLLQERINDFPIEELAQSCALAEEWERTVCISQLSASTS